jgi:hypothetical protein
MTRIRTIIVSAGVTAAICLPLGAYAGDPILRNHPHLQKARHALKEAWREVTASQEANEGVWGDEGGHGKECKEAIERASRELDRAAEWVDSHR